MRSMHRHNGSTSMPQKNRATVFTVGAASKRPSINHSIRSDCPTRNHESIQTNGRPKDQRLGKHRICACLVGQGSGGCITECGRRPPPIRFTSFFYGGIRFSHRRFFFTGILHFGTFLVAGDADLYTQNCAASFFSFAHFRILRKETP